MPMHMPSQKQQLSTVFPVSRIQRKHGSRRVALRFAVLLTLLVLCAAAWAQQNSSLVFSDDGERAVLEAYVVNGWVIDSGGVTSSKAQAHSGYYSYASTTTGSNTGVYAAFSGTTPDPLYFKFWVYIPSSYTLSSGSTSRLAGLTNTSTYVIYPVNVINSSGTLYLNASSTTGTHSISRDTWHAVEMAYSASGQTISISLDGTTDISASRLSLASQNAVYLGLSAGSGTVYFDDLTVSSAASGSPSAGVTVRHAYPGNRTAFRAKTYLWGAASTDTLVTTVDSSVVSSITAPGNYQEPVIGMTSLAAGTHTLTVSLNNSSGTTRESWTEAFSKPAAGTPTIGIDENNNLVHNGNKLFPITPWLMNADNVNGWLSAGYINANGFLSQYANSYSVSQYKTFMEGTDTSAALNCLSTGTLSIGPGTGRGGDYNTIGAYASALTNEACVLGWFGYDEASVNGIATSTLTALASNVHAVDNNHPVFYDDATFPYLHQEWYYPTLVADVYSSDNYPICYSNPFWNVGQRTFTDWVHDLDREANANYNLVPNWNIIEAVRLDTSNYPNFVCTSANHDATALSSTIIYNEAWMAIIHGRKGLSWYNDAYPSGTTTYSPVCSADTSMACFPANPSTQGIGLVTGQIASITPNSLLGYTTRTVSTNQTTNCVYGGNTGTRVDASVSEDSNYIWIYAARLTDPGCSSTENSLSALSTTITVSGLSGSSTVADWVTSNRTFSMTNGAFTDTFSPWGVHIYRISKSNLTAPAAPTNVQSTVVTH
ncbi:MAG: hypothetical protein P4M01_04445 [Acidobacteriota bacterium]|nr:hypothetical protein [Acidobacteriota bacterium]